MTQWQSPACHASNPGRRISYLCQLLRNRRCESFSPAKDGLRQACRRTGRGRCPRADLHSAPGRSGHQACRHYDRRARCFAGSGQPVGGVNPAPWTVSPTKPGPDCALGTTTLLGRNRGGTPAGERARQRRAAQAASSWRDPHPLVREVVPCVCRRSASLFLRHCEEPTGPARSGRPDDRLRDEAIQNRTVALDCFASLAMTAGIVGCLTKLGRKGAPRERIFVRILRRGGPCGRPAAHAHRCATGTHEGCPYDCKHDPRLDAAA